jgi:hypothetical protein
LLAFGPARFLHLEFGSRSVFSSIFSVPPAAVFFVQIFGPRVSGLVPAEVRPVSSSCTRTEKRFGPFPLRAVCAGISVFLPFSRLRAAWSGSRPTVFDFPRVKRSFFPFATVVECFALVLARGSAPGILAFLCSVHPGAGPRVPVSVSIFVAIFARVACKLLQGGSWSCLKLSDQKV